MIGVKITICVFCVCWVPVICKENPSTCPEGFGFYYSHGRLLRDASYPKYNASCYKFSNDLTSWVEASKICRGLGANLVSIESAGEQHHIENILQTHTNLQKPIIVKYRDWGYWTSGSDAWTEARWFWTRPQRTFTYSNWNPGEPSNSYNVKGLAENCLHLWSRMGWKWNDLLCENSMQSYICEKDATPC